MLKGDLIYIRHNRITTEKYDFANVTLSDGLESFAIGFDLSILPLFESLRRGDNVLVTVDISTEGRNTRLTISDVKKSEKKMVG